MKTVSFEQMQSMQPKNTTIKPAFNSSGSGQTFAALLKGQMFSSAQEEPVKYAPSYLPAASRLNASDTLAGTVADTIANKVTDTIADTASDRDSMKNILLLLCSMMFSNASSGEGSSNMTSTIMMSLLQALTGTSGSGAEAAAALSSVGSAATEPASRQAGETGQTVVNAAMSRLGDPYSMARRGSGNYVDCSYLAKWSYAQAGVYIPSTSVAQAKYCHDNGYTVSKSELQPGDLVFWTKGSCNCGRWNEIHHVGIYAGNNKVIEARSSKGQVVIDDLWGENGGNWRVVMYARPRAAS